MVESGGTWGNLIVDNTGPGLYFSAVSCPDAAYCTAVGTVAGGGGMVASTPLTPTDTTPPTLQVPADFTIDATNPTGAVVDYTVTATDPDNTAAQITIDCVPASGSTFPLGPNGTSATTTVTCNASDPAGNNATPMSFNVTVLGVHDQLLALEGQVNAATNLDNGQQHSLVSQLQLADQYFASGDTKAAVKQLDAFVKKVDQYTPPLTSTQASDWIAAADQIIAVIG